MMGKLEWGQEYQKKKKVPKSTVINSVQLMICAFTLMGLVATDLKLLRQ